MRYTPLMIFLLTVAPLMTVERALAQPPRFGPEDRDVDRIISRIKRFEELANDCASSSCPTFDCTKAQAIHVRLRDARHHLRAMHYWLSRAAQNQMAHFTNLVNQSIRDTERARGLQKAIAWQRYIHDISSSLLDLSSTSASVHELYIDARALQATSYAKAAGHFDKLYEGIKDFESLRATLLESAADKDVPTPVADLVRGLGRFNSAELNDAKSTLSDMKSAMDATYKYGGDWRKVLKQGKGAAAVGQIAGRYLKAHLEVDIAKRQREADRYLSEVVAAQGVARKEFDELQGMRTTRNKVEDAVIALTRLVVIDPVGSGSMTQCLLKLTHPCKHIDLSYGSQHRLPTEAAIEDFSLVTPRDRDKPAGPALIALTKGLPAVETWLQDVPTLRAATRPSIWVDKSTYAPGEQMTLRFTAPACLPAASWFGVVASKTPHGREDVNAGVVSRKHLLQNAERGSTVIAAPNEPGSYDLRMNNRETGEEIFSLTFEVKATARIQSETAGNIDWSFTPPRGSAQVGKRHTYRCPPYSPTLGFVYGTDVYSADSAVCYAAAHAGVISTSGGTVTIEIRRGAPSYQGSARHGVTSRDDAGSTVPDYSGSFVFIR